MFSRFQSCFPHLASVFLSASTGQSARFVVCFHFPATFHKVSYYKLILFTHQRSIQGGRGVRGYGCGNTRLSWVVTIVPTQDGLPKWCNPATPGIDVPPKNCIQHVGRRSRIVLRNLFVSVETAANHIIKLSSHGV